MSSASPTIMWFRRDLRLSDHAALTEACARGGPVIALFIRDALVDGLGAAPKWRLGLSLDSLAASLKAKGHQLILRSGPALDVLQELIAQTGADAVFWSRLYDPASIERDTLIKSTLKSDGIEAKSFGGHLMHEPWSVETKTGGYYKVYTPFWNNVKNTSRGSTVQTPARIPPLDNWPDSDALSDWNMGTAMNRGEAIMRPHARIGEAAAQERLGVFIEGIVADYITGRNLPWKDGTSNLSDSLALGEISPLQCWEAGSVARHEGKQGAEVFLKEIVWREFAYHLMHHTPRILTDNWKPVWDDFPWNTDETKSEVIAWKQGRTGIPFVDAAMREMYVTGKMHNRGRMIVASYLTKHLMTDWRIGQKWFEDCLTDWDPASNAMGWQWSAGSGPDATPYFRVFNPVTQLDKFDANRDYTNRWIAEGRSTPHADANSYFDAIPRSWNLSADNAYPAAVVSPEMGRKIALDAYSNRDL
ncbi:MAG: deoxyribodipyrimidine photo-lyase [Ascidiaceihabitans sp.]|jgi:deoxyribodipyrimidine photo-lyase